jgi:hypothetical protein
MTSFMTSFMTKAVPNAVPNAVPKVPLPDGPLPTLHPDVIERMERMERIERAERIEEDGGGTPRPAVGFLG